MNWSGLCLIWTHRALADLGMAHVTRGMGQLTSYPAWCTLVTVPLTPGAVLRLCDEIRDVVLPEIGVRLGPPSPPPPEHASPRPFLHPGGSIIGASTRCLLPLRRGPPGPARRLEARGSSRPARRAQAQRGGQPLSFPSLPLPPAVSPAASRSALMCAYPSPPPRPSLLPHLLFLHAAGGGARAPREAAQGGT